MATSSAITRQKAAKLEARLVRSLRIPMERRRMERRLLKFAQDHPKEGVAVLLKYLDHENPRVTESVRRVLDEATAPKEGMRAVLDNFVHHSQLVRRNAVLFLTEKRGFHAATYASFYEHTYLLIAMARNKEIPVSDIEALAEVSKDTYLEGETILALQDIAACLDFIKHRHRTADTLKGYVIEMLKMAPDLTRMGAYDGRIEEPLRRAILASKSRSVDETKEIINVRALESSVRGELNRVGRLVNGEFEERPVMDYSQMSGTDVFILSKLRTFLETVTAMTIAGKREEGLRMLSTYLETDYQEYWEQSKARIDGHDRSALFSVYIIGLVCLKLASYLMSQTAEDIYQKYYRGLEPEPSVHIIPWPEPIMKMIA